jgi:hypothetical protein
MKKIKWLKEPEEHDYAAAEDYLSLSMTEWNARTAAVDLRRAPMETKKAKDISRASGLPVLSDLNVHVAKDLKKIRAGEEISPILLCRTGGKLIIADGYHRMSAVYYLDEDAEIPCKLV